MFLGGYKCRDAALESLTCGIEFLCSGLNTEMTTLSLISRNCGSGGGNSDWAIECGLQTGVHNDFFVGGLLLGSVRRRNGVWLKNLGGSRIRSRN